MTKREQNMIQSLIKQCHCGELCPATMAGKCHLPCYAPAVLERILDMADMEGDKDKESEGKES